jgi:hypothetical protein
VSGAFTFVTVLVAAAPLVAFSDGPLLDGIITAIIAVILFIIALALPPGEAKHQVKSIRLMLFFFIIPALWMALQAIPMPLRSLANPAWQSAGSALGAPLIGSITIDTGRTVLALVQYLTVLGLILASSAICINRSRAEKILFSLTAATTAMALLLIAVELLEITSYSIRESLQGASALGVVVSAAAILHAFERYETRGKKHDASLSQFARTESLYFAANVICWISVVKFASVQVAFAVGCGFATAIMIVLGRAVGAGRWTIMTFAGLAFAAVLGLAATRFVGQGDLTVRYSSAPAVDVSTAERIRADTGWQGSGAGSFTALLPIYREIGEAANSAPTTAADLAVALGTPALGLITILVLTAVALFVRGALSRGRDSFYPTLGASSAVILLIEGFVDTSAIRTSIMIITATIAGLALAQIASRTVTNGSQ